ncbi:scavenger receptor class F member 1 isoform X1 [Bufo gargarizans]|uniref:scavenger receptor class F member 1 isoform X1 n=1 Tax=Bufo gargarizans TaxID=30331 RepID=UPI001CF37C9C|nr:scavenger receptor class F member 1 isoform X1 [Bufo gargarizans]
MTSYSRRLKLMLIMWTWLPRLNSQDLDPAGKNVCTSDSVTNGLVCCPGWKQEGRECTAAICEGADACKTDEICIRPGVCRCKPGFFGADCNSPCPDQYWGSDCKQRCSCHPFGKCDGATGKCTCYPKRWGPACQNPCHCGPHGSCDQLTGSCKCEPGWWAQHCNKQCVCNPDTSHCNQTNGQCMCYSGWWGYRCSIKCNCNGSPCLQTKGNCMCREGWYGPGCEHQCDCVNGKCNSKSGECECYMGYKGKRCIDTCPAGYYGPKCEKRCGKCKLGQTCSPFNGSCASCEPGWTGTRCDLPCPTGYYGENCTQNCPKCLGEEECSRENGTCLNCDPGKTGSRCEFFCPAGSYGSRCENLCPLCIHGNCDPVTGECVCDSGYWKPSCNETCPHGYYGSNCSSICDCSDGMCDLKHGRCQLTSSQKAAIVAGVLVPLCLLLLLCCCCCCCCCGNNESEGKDRVSNSDRGCLSRMKHNFQGALVNVGSFIPCCSVGNDKVSWVTVSHHDTELPFNHSFIESPSTGWLSENSFSSFESDEDGPVYCVPPREGMSVADLDGFQEISSKCNVFPDAMALNTDDVSAPFSIPRTSSNAKSKRPSVSFAEGTKFESRSSITDTPHLVRKPKLALSLPKLSSIQSQTVNAEESQKGEYNNEHYDTINCNPESEDHPKLQRSGPVGRRRTMSNAQKASFKEVTEVGLKENSEMKRKVHNISTLYVTVGHPRKPCKPRRKSEGNVDGAVQAVLKRFGSFQKGIPKPTRRSLLQYSNSKVTQPKDVYPEEVKLMAKNSSNDKVQDRQTNQIVLPSSSIIKIHLSDGSIEKAGNPDKPENMYSNLHDPEMLEQAQTVDHIYQTADGREDVEPKYENISISNSCVNNELEPSPLYEDAEMNCDNPNS